MLNYSKSLVVLLLQ